MNIDKKVLEKIAHLARLEFNEKDAEAMIGDMNNMLSFVEKLKEVDTTGVEPLMTMSHEINNLRADEVKNELPHEEALKNAPVKDDLYFKVPKVIE